MPVSKVALFTPDIELLESSLRLRIHSLERRIAEWKEGEPHLAEPDIERLVGYLRNLKDNLTDLLSKLDSSHSRGLIYEGEGGSEHIK